jgi:hypothetical protein
VMLQKKLFFIFSALICTVFAVLAIGCAKTADYKDVMTENILLAINEEDFEKFTKDFDDALKQDVTMEMFPYLLAEVTGKVGYYIDDSKELIKVHTENGVTTARYLAEFESMQDIEVIVVFQKINRQDKVVGLFFQ